MTIKQNEINIKKKYVPFIIEINARGRIIIELKIL